MIDPMQFDRIKREHGSYASWAIWASPSAGPKSNVGDLRVFDLRANPTLLETLNNDVTMVGLNISRSFSEPFRNFHDPRPVANDFKIRYAFTGTRYYGAYMTDVIKRVEMVQAAALLKHLKLFPDLILDNIATLRRELHDLGGTKPTLLAFGRTAHALLARHLAAHEYSQLIKLTHYSHRIPKDKYRDIVLAEIGAQGMEAR